jgi:hypothetical protein
MTLYEFRLLTDDEQALKVWEGEYINFRDEGENRVMLYRVNQFYVEVYYNQDSNTILRFNPFTSKRRLELYLKFSLN